MRFRSCVLLVAAAVVAASVGCCGPCGQQAWQPPTYNNYGPCNFGGECGSGCGKADCGSSCTTCASAPTSCGDASCGCEANQTAVVESSDCSSCGQVPCGCGPKSWPNPFAALGFCSGCGPLYWSEWHNDPPDICDPCDCHGNWTGSGQVKVGYHGPSRAGSASAQVVTEEPTVVEEAG